MVNGHFLCSNVKEIININLLFYAWNEESLSSMPNMKLPVMMVGFVNIDIMSLVINRLFTKRENS
jgi:hypothetical protein